MAAMKRSEAVWIFVVLLLVAGVVAGADRIPSKEASDDHLVGGAFTSTGWYCLAPPSLAASTTVAMANVGTEALRLRTSTIGETRRSDATEADLPAKRRVTFGVGSFGIGTGTFVGEAFGAATVADSITFATGGGVASSRCTVQPWDRWLIPTASTARGQDHFLVLSNPFQEEAVVRVRVIAPDRDIVPARLKDLVVPALSQSMVALADFVPETATFGLQVDATQGRIVAGRYSRLATREGQTGTSFVLGARAPSTKWYFAVGGSPADGSQSISIINPGEKEALVQMVFHTETGQSAPDALQEIAVPAGRQVLIDPAAHLGAGTSHGMSLTSVNDVPVVAERTTYAPVGSVRAYDSEIGMTAAGRRWTLPLGGPQPSNDTIAILNPGRVPATLTITFITESGETRPSELAAIRVEPNTRVLIDVTAMLAGAYVTGLVEAVTGEVVVERRSVVPAASDFTDTAGVVLE